MKSIRFAVAAAMGAAAAMIAAQPAAAQFFYKAPDMSAPAIVGGDESFSLALPGSTTTEYRAGAVWNLRAALNVAALQCDFEPTLLTTSNYNAMIAHHKDELAGSFKTLEGYFKRTRSTARAAQVDFDQYGTRIYSGYSAVQAQRNFCDVAGELGRDAIFADRGELYKIALAGLPRLRKAQTPKGEEYFGSPASGYRADIPSLDPKCWKKGALTKKCASAWQTAQSRR